MSTHHSHLDFSAEDWDQPVKFFDKCWVIANKHNPALNKALELNNRVFVFQLRGKQPNDVLVVLGCGSPATIDAVKKLEQETSAPVAWVVGNGGGHHLFLDLWYTAFPAARVLVPAKRVPMTRNGRELATKYAARWQLLHGPRPAQLVEEFGSEIDVVSFDQLLGPSDETGAALLNSPKDHTDAPTSRGGFSLMMAMGKFMKAPGKPNDEVALFHRASGLVIGGHNYQFIFTPKGHKAPPKFKMKTGGFPMSLMMKLMMPNGAFVSALEGMPAPIADSRLHAEEWDLVLDWDIRAWTTAHNPPTCVGPDLSGSEL